jgi:hypothetical protein
MDVGEASTGLDDARYIDWLNNLGPSAYQIGHGLLNPVYILAQVVGIDIILQGSSKILDLSLRPLSPSPASDRPWTHRIAWQPPKILSTRAHSEWLCMPLITKEIQMLHE